MYDIVFKFNEDNEVYISEQKEHMYEITRYSVVYNGISVKSDNVPQVSSYNFYIRGENKECDYEALISTYSMIHHRINFIKGIIALITHGYRVGFEFCSGRKMLVNVSRKNDLLHLIEHTDVLMEDLISMFDKSGFSCKL